MMEFHEASKLSSFLAKGYAEAFLRLLVNYQDISASEAASRLNLHIRTAQDFLEGLSDLGILEQKEVHEKKRPYFRYTLIKPSLKLEVDLGQFAQKDPGEGLGRRVREIKNDLANFSIARSGNSFSAITLWVGEGRERTERKISLTTPQGQFLFHLPFPQARAMSIAEVMESAGVDEEYSTEIQDIVDELAKLGVIEVT
jgi:predicted transcriptional regulator